MTASVARRRPIAPAKQLRVLLWHLHGSWTTSFVQGAHQFLLPTLPERGAWGRGRADTWVWPDNAVEVTPGELGGTDVDVVVLQRPEEIGLAERWLGRRLGSEVPAIYVEHNTPRGEGNVPYQRHPVADRDDIVLVHVTHFNALMWDSGRAPVEVIEHGIADPGHRYTGDLPHAAVAINEPVRRWRVTGTDLLPAFAEAAPLDVFGLGLDGLNAQVGLGPGELNALGALTQQELHERMPRCRVYVHPFRWTSLGLSLIEAMLLGMPVVGLATTEAVEAVPADAGVLSNRVDVLVEAVRELVADPEAARRKGERARRFALQRYGIETFLDHWERLLAQVAR